MLFREVKRGVRRGNETRRERWLRFELKRARDCARPDAGHGSSATRARTRLSGKAVATCTGWSVELGAMHRDERHGLERSGLVVLCDRTQVFDRWGAAVRARE
jgi:hypothetical protein